MTPAQRELLLDLVNWALDQDHDAQGMGDQEFLLFLSADDLEPELEIERIREELNALVAADGPLVKMHAIDCDMDEDCTCMEVIAE